MQDMETEIQRVTQKIEDARNVFMQTQQSLKEQLSVFNKLDANDQHSDDISTIYIYKMFLAKEKALY